MKMTYFKKLRGLIYDKRFLMSLLLMMVLPVIASVVLGIEMQANQIKEIPTVIIDRDGSEFSRMLTDEIEKNEIFDIQYYVQTDEDLKQLIEKNKAMVGVIIPNSFSKNMLKGEGPQILIFYDGSQMSVVSAAKSRMDEILLTLKAGYLKKIYEGKLDIVPQASIKHVQPITATYRQLYNPTKNYRNFLLPGMLIAMLQVGLVIVGVERIKDSCRTFKDMLKVNVSWAFLGTFSIIVTLSIQFLCYALLYRGSVLAGLVVTLLYAIGMTAFGMMIGLLIRDRVFSTQVACILVLPSSILGGYTFPLFAMPQFFESLGHILPYTHYAETIRDLCMKGLGLRDTVHQIFWLAGFIFIEWVVSYFIYIIKKKINSKSKAERTEVVL